MKKVVGFFKEEGGATALEYALMLGLIAVAIVVGATAMGVNSNARFVDMAGKILLAGQ